MRFFRTEMWSYAVLLIVLFAIGALATRATILYIEDTMPAGDTHVIVMLVWVLALGFMLIAGAFGLWAIKFSAEAESRRRIGRFVETIDYLRDGFIAVDRTGRIRGCNPAASLMAPTSNSSPESLQSMFPFLSDQDISLLLGALEPHEVERDFSTLQGLRTLRFRSQPSEDIVILTVSDITTMNLQRQHSRQMARLQLIGQLARGIAHDFNDLLAGIAGHASLLTHVRPGSHEMSASVAAITRSAEQGIALAGHLLELSTSGAGSQTVSALVEHIRTAGIMLRDSLPPGWRVDEHIPESLPRVAIAGVHVEQLLLNIGLLAAESMESRGGRLSIRAGTHGSGPLMESPDAAGVIILVCANINPDAQCIEEAAVVRREGHDLGIIESVIQSLIHEAGGRIDTLQTLDGSRAYRISLPIANLPSPATSQAELTDEIKAYVANWNVLVAHPRGEYAALDASLALAGLHATFMDSIIPVLARVEEERNLDAMILDRYLLGPEAKGLIRAVVKLHPSTALVVLCDQPQQESETMGSDAVFVNGHSDVLAVIHALMDARSLAVRRRNSGIGVP